ncbi:MAG: type II secretion system protein GspG [Nitrospirota bacterium]
MLMLFVTICDTGCARIDSSRYSNTVAKIVLLDEYILQFYKDTGRYPTVSEGLEALNRRPDDTPTWKGPYLKKEVPDDGWQNPYIYIYPAKYGNKSYDLYSYGENKQDDHGLKDDITNWRSIDKNYYKTHDRSKYLLLIVVLLLIAAIVLWLFKRGTQRS